MSPQKAKKSTTATSPSLRRGHKGGPAKAAPSKVEGAPVKAAKKQPPARPAKSTAAKASRATTTAAKAAPAKTRPARPTKPAVDKRTMTSLRKQLEAERGNLSEQAEALEEERRRLAADRDAADDSFTEESGEGATTTMEQEKDISIAANVADLLEKVEAALERMDAGTYGYCERCGKAIGKPRLEALPWAALCISCKQKEEHRFV